MARCGVGARGRRRDEAGGLGARVALGVRDADAGVLRGNGIRGGALGIAVLGASARGGRGRGSGLVRRRGRVLGRSAAALGLALFAKGVGFVPCALRGAEERRGRGRGAGLLV